MRYFLSSKSFLFYQILLFLSILTFVSGNGKCSGSVSSLFGAYTHNYNYQGDINRWVNNMIISSDGLHTYGTEVGSVNAGDATDYSNVVFYKRTQDLTIEWSKKLDVYVPPGGMALDSSDTIFFTTFEGTTCHVGKISSSDGTLMTYNVLDAGISSCNKIVVSKDSNYVYVAANNNTSPNIIVELNATTLAYSFALSQDSQEILDLATITLSGNSRSLFTLSQHSSEDTVFATLTFPSTTVVNQNKFACTSCSAAPSGRVYVSSTNIAYVSFLSETLEQFFVVDLSTMALNHAFVQASAQAGTLVTSVGYLSDISQIYTFSYSSVGTILRFFDTTTNVFTQVYSTAGSSLLSSASFGGFIYVGSQTGGSTALLHKINYKDDIIRTALVQPAVADIAADGAAVFVSSGLVVADAVSGRTSTITSISFATLPAINYFTQTTYPLNYNNGSYWSVYASQGTSSTIKINTPCLSDNSGGMTTAMANHFDGSIPPAWLLSNPDLSGLIVNAPVILPAEEVSYNVGINFAYSGNTYTQYNTLVVHQCFLANCERCEYATRRTECTSCRKGFALSLDQTRCEKEFLPVQPMSLASHGIIAVGVGSGATSSAASSTASAQGFWALINQYQLFLLFPFLKTYMPADLEYYLTEFELFSFNFGFMDSFELPLLNDLIEKLDYSQDETIYENNGFESGAFAVNYNSMFIALFIVFCCNLVFILFYVIFKKARQGGKCKKVFDWFTGFFYLTTYIRTVIEASQFAFMGSLLEVTNFDSLTDHTVSFLISLIFTIFMILIPVFVFYYYKKKDGAVSESLLNEFYDGTKDKKLAKLFIIFFFIRRFTTVGILVLLRSTNPILRCCFFVPTQLSYLIYFISVKPFEENKDNVIEILNESIFSILSIFLAIFQDESMWVGGMSSVIIVIVMMNGFMISIVLLVNNIIDVVKWCKERKNRKKIRTARSTEKVQVEQASSSSLKSEMEKSKMKNSDEEVGMYKNSARGGSPEGTNRDGIFTDEIKERYQDGEESKDNDIGE